MKQENGRTDFPYIYFSLCIATGKRGMLLPLRHEWRLWPKLLAEAQSNYGG